MSSLFQKISEYNEISIGHVFIVLKRFI